MSDNATFLVALGIIFGSPVLIVYLRLSCFP